MFKGKKINGKRLTILKLFTPNSLLVKPYPMTTQPKETKNTENKKIATLMKVAKTKTFGGGKCNHRQKRIQNKPKKIILFTHIAIPKNRQAM